VPEPTPLDSTAVLERYDRAFAVLDEVVRATASPDWSATSPCPGWTARDVLSHLLWGQDLVRRWAIDQPPTDPNSRDWTQGVAEADLASLWDSSRTQTRTLLTPNVLAHVVRTRLFGEITIAEFLWTFPNDALLHAWDIAAATGAPVTFPEDLIGHLLTWSTANEHLLRRPGGIGPQEAVADGAGIVDRWLGFAGRKPDWAPLAG
jgi:uncharacterized protein (TIGR03086 family)